jgi:hypothetical protein
VVREDTLAGKLGGSAMVQTRIKPYLQQVAEKARRAEQTRVYRRNQVFGLLLVAAAILSGGSSTPIRSGSFRRGGGVGWWP